MPKLPAYRANELAGWIQVPANEGFGWTLRLRISQRSSVTVPIRVLTKDRGWTQIYFAELDGLAQSQLDELVANQILNRDDAAA
jgi:hypothetical protein